jgi:putative hydrolase of HD superfamily
VSTPPVVSLIDFLDQTNRLKLLPRTGWLLNGIQPCESVADHSYATALLALALAGAVNADWAAAGLDGPLDLGRVAQLALLHDLPESVVTDLPKRSAELLGVQAKRGAEEMAMTSLVRELPQGQDFLALWREYADAATPEARLVRDADKLEMVHQALQYERRGARTLDEFWHGHRWHFAVAEQVFVTLRQMRT